MAAASAFRLITPADGEAFLISRMNRAPGRASVAARLREVGDAATLRLSIETPSNRARTSSRFDAAISLRTPMGSATAHLNEAAQDVAGRAGANCIERHDSGEPQRLGLAGRHQKRAGVERNHAFVGLPATAGEHGSEPACLPVRRSADDLVQRQTTETRAFRGDLELL